MQQRNLLIVELNGPLLYDTETIWKTSFPEAPRYKHIKNLIYSLETYLKAPILRDIERDSAIPTWEFHLSLPEFSCTYFRRSSSNSQAISAIVRWPLFTWALQLKLPGLMFSEITGLADIIWANFIHMEEFSMSFNEGEQFEIFAKSYHVRSFTQSLF